MTTGTGPKPALELDVLRGFAAILMVANHAGLEWLSARDAETSLSGAIVFLGGLAPVVFFFVTGFGTALSAAGRPRPAPLGPLFVRAALLIVADQFFAWTHGTAWVLDFFSFIGLTVVIVGMLSRLERPTRACGMLVIVLLVVRYAVGPMLMRGFDLPPVVDWMVGVRGVRHVSYPLSPWLVYPLLGMMVGRWYSRGGGELLLRLKSIASTGLAIMVLLGSSAWMASRGHELFRWGTVSSSFFVFSLSALLALSIVCVVLAGVTPRLAEIVALTGIASFALIPLHYALIGYGTLLLSARIPLAPQLAGELGALLVLLCFALSKRFAKAMMNPGVGRQRGWLYPLLLALVAGLAAIAWGWPGASLERALLTAFLGQLAIAALLSLRSAFARNSSSVQIAGA